MVSSLLHISGNKRDTGNSGPQLSVLGPCVTTGWDIGFTKNRGASPGSQSCSEVPEDLAIGAN